MTREQIANILERLIPEGKDKAVKGEDLWEGIIRARGDEGKYDWPDYREMRNTIADLIPWTCSCSKGYYKAATTDERRQAVAYLESYIKALARRRRAIMEKYSSDFCGVQLKLEL